MGRLFNSNSVAPIRLYLLALQKDTKADIDDMPVWFRVKGYFRVKILPIVGRQFYHKKFLSIKGRIIPWVSYINTEIRLVNLERAVFRGCGTRNQLSCAEFKGILTHCMSNRTAVDYHENTRMHPRCYED